MPGLKEDAATGTHTCVRAGTHRAGARAAHSETAVLVIFGPKTQFILGIQMAYAS